MTTRVTVRVNDVVTHGELFDEQAPDTVAGLLSHLPIVDRTIQVRWSGDAWRTEQNYPLRPAGSPVENVAGRLRAGDIIYFPGKENIKVGIAYGDAQWLAPFMVPVDVCHLGRLTDGVDEFVQVCRRIIFDGPMEVEMSVGS